MGHEENALDPALRVLTMNPDITLVGRLSPSFRLLHDPIESIINFRRPRPTLGELTSATEDCRCDGKVP